MNIQKSDFRALTKPSLWIIPTIATAILVLLAQFSFPAFHAFVSLLPIIISFIMFAFIWSVQGFKKNSFLLYLACGYFWVGSLEIFHVFTHQGMNTFIEGDNNLSAQFWVTARYFEAFMLLLASSFFVAQKNLNKYLLLIVFGAVTACLVALILSGHFPTLFVEETGLTNIKIYSEYLIIILLAFAVFALSRRENNIPKEEVALIITSIVLTICAEFAFSYYVSNQGFVYLSGHIFKLFSSWLIFQAIVVYNFKKPFLDLMRLEEYNRGLFQNSVTGMSLCKMDGSFIDVNPAFAKLTGYSVEELLKLDYWQIIPEKYSSQKKDLLNSANTIGKYGPSVKEYIRKDGSLVPVEFSGMVLLHNGEPHMWSSVEDITERQKLQKITMELEFQKNALDEHAIVSIADAKGDITYVNDKLCEISGYSREELLGKNHRIFKSGEHSAEFYNNLWQTITSGKPWRGEVKNRKKNGEYYWVVSTIVSFLNEQGQPTRYVCIHTDITERNEAENAIRQFKTTLDLTEDEVYMFWPDTLKFFYVNQAAKDQLGWSDEEFSDMTPIDIRPEFQEPEFRKILISLIRGTHRSATFEAIHQRHNGEVLPVEIHMQYFQPNGEKPRFVAIVKDITERQKVDKAKSEFISTVSHELRTPLTSVKGAIGLMDSGILNDSPEKLQSMIKIASTNCERLALLIDDILDMERINAGNIEFQMRPTDLTALLEEAVEANKGYGDEYGVSFFCLNTDEPLLVNVEKDRMMQVMANLLSNAVKFSPRGGKVEVSVSRHNESIRIVVKDYGSGIPTEARATIFDRFTQADSSDQRAKGGTGLGLYIAKMIVEGHDGTIGFTTEMGKGTTFYVDLPEIEEKFETDG